MSGQMNEAAVMEVYSEYKRSRDVIDTDVYLALRDSARERIELMQHEHEIQQITKMAVNARAAFSSAEADAEAENSSVIGVVGTITKSLSKAAKFMTLPNSLSTSPARGVSLAAGIGVIALGIGLLGGGVFKMGSNTSSDPAYATEIFLQDDNFVDKLIADQQEWQYGFSAGTGPTARAFQAGELSIDLSLIAQQIATENESVTNNQRFSDALGKRLQLHAPYVEAGLLEVKSLSHHKVEELESGLASHYSKEENQARMFQYGQWVEYHYLLSSLAVENGRPSIYQNNYKRLDSVVSGLEAHLRIAKLLSENDLAKIKEVGSENLTIEDLDQISNLLLKVRSVLSYG